MEKNIYKQSILDAKAVRASIIANAKAELQESIEPKVQEMIRTKLSEELEDELQEEEELDETLETEETLGLEGENQVSEESEVDEVSLDEILAELDELEEGIDEGQEQVEIVDEAEEDETEESEEGEEESEDETEESEEGEEDSLADDETKIVDITLGDLKQVLQSVMAQTGDSMEDIEMDAVETGEETGDDTAISLDEILAELEKESGEKVEEKKMTDDDKKIEEVEKELEEAKKTIATLNETLQEINLLNAKLLYMNKIFKSKSLTESEKIRVIKTFDKSKSVKEVKTAFEILKESFNVKKSTIKESIGFASKAIGSAPKKPIIESDDFVSKWQKLAGIKK